MGKEIDMQLMRYINLFERISRVSTLNCFVYNNTIYFAVPKSLVRQAIGRGGENIKMLSETLRRKIRVVSLIKSEGANLEESAKAKVIGEFVKEVVAPVELSSFEFQDGVFSVSGTRESKAILIGRNRVKEQELSEVLQRTFGIKEFKVA